MNITTAREAIKRYNTNVAKTHQEETKKKMQQLKDLQATCPATELVEITSNKDMIRTVEKQKLFNGPWLKGDTVENTTLATISVEIYQGHTKNPRPRQDRPDRNARHRKIHLLVRDQGNRPTPRKRTRN